MALNLNKLFVRVKGNVSLDTIKSTSLETANQKKVYFVENSNQIVVRGVAYGVDPSTVSSISDLQTLIGAEKISDSSALGQSVIERLRNLEDIKVATGSTDYLSVTPDGSVPAIGVNIVGIQTGNNGLVDAADAKGYIDDAVDAATTEVEAGKGIDVNTSTGSDGQTIYTIDSSLNLTYTPATSGQSATINLVDKDGTYVFGQVNVSDIIGNGVIDHTSYDAATGILTLTFKQADGTPKDVEIDLHKMLDIGDIMIHNDSSNYLEITTYDSSNPDSSQAVFKALIHDVSTATASSTGLVDAYNVQQYVDSKVSDKNVDAEGDAYVTATATDNKVSVSTNIGSFTATKGTAGNYGADGTQTTAPSHGNLVGEENKLADASVIAAEVKKYVDGELEIEAARSDAKNKADIAALDTNVDSTGGTNVSVNVVETDGIITAVTVAENYATIDASTIEVTVGDESKMVKASDIAHLKAYVDEQSQKLAVEADGDSYVTAEVDGANNKKINVSTNIGDLAVTTAAGQPSVMTGVEGKLADASDIAGTVTEFVNARINEERAKLDATANVHDTSSYINVSIGEVDGLLDSAASSIDVTYGSFTEATPTDGIATREGVQNFVDTYDFWEDYNNTPSNNG